MASVAFHLAVGKQYCKYYDVRNKERFLDGVMAPDCAKDRTLSHYGKKWMAPSYTEAVYHKTGLYEFCKNNKIYTDYKRGVFLHLVTDYIFYKEYLLNLERYKAIEFKSHNEIKNVIYMEYNIMNPWLFEKYDISPSDLPEEANGINDGDLQIFKYKDLQDLIEECAKLNIDEIYNQILQKDLRWMNKK